MQVVRGLWDSWADGALLLDKAAGLFLDPARVRLLEHEGAHFSVRGPLNISRPPQGHPIIVQAGSSTDGIRLAAAEADLAFTAQDTVEDALAYRAELTATEGAAGRGAPALVVMPGIMPIVGRTDAEAREKFAALQGHTDIAAGIRQLSGRWGYDLSTHPLDGPVPEPGPRIHGESRVRLLLNRARADNYTLRELAAFAIASHGHRIIIGSAETVANDLQHWFEIGAADGFNLIPASMPDGLDDFVDLVVPILQERRLFRERYEETTLRVADQAVVFRGSRNLTSIRSPTMRERSATSRSTGGSRQTRFTPHRTPKRTATRSVIPSRTVNSEREAFPISAIDLSSAPSAEQFFHAHLTQTTILAFSQGDLPKHQLDA